MVVVVVFYFNRFWRSQSLVWNCLSVCRVKIFYDWSICKLKDIICSNHGNAKFLLNWILYWILYFWRLLCRDLSKCNDCWRRNQNSSQGVYRGLLSQFVNCLFCISAIYVAVDNVLDFSSILTVVLSLHGHAPRGRGRTESAVQPLFHRWRCTGVVVRA